MLPFILFFNMYCNSNFVRYHKNGQSLLVLLPSEEPEMLKVTLPIYRNNNQYSSCACQYFLRWGKGGVDGLLFEAGRLLTFPSYRVGAYSRLGTSSNKNCKK